MNSGSFLKHRHRVEQTLGRAVYGLFTEYETPKLVLIHSFTLTILLRIMQIALLIYSVLYLLLYEKGYQKQDTAIISSVTLKVKGIGYVQSASNETIVIDVADYIIPPSENDAIFIMSNFVQTDQVRSRCAESMRLKEARCKSDQDCRNKPPSSKASGRWTGRCILPSDADVASDIANATRQPTGLCEYAGWCPPENDEAGPMYVNEFLNFTIFIKNFIEFPTFHVKHKNMVDNLQSCIFHPQNSKDCPIFTLGYILTQAEKDPEESALMLRYGAVVSVKVDWDCNLDRHIKLCKPEYTFARLDVPFRDKPFSQGFNFRYASYWKNSNTNNRMLTKAYGLRLIIAVSGKAGKFDTITLSLNTGSLVGVFGLATFLCDIILLHLSKQSRTYRNHVFEKVHLRTRFNSVLEQPNELVNRRNSEKHTSNRASISNGTTHRSSVSDGSAQEPAKAGRKTVSMRPLTLVDPKQMMNSEKV